MRTFGVGESARLLETNIDTIKKWSYLFSSYLSTQANPGKNKPRCFNINDIRTFSYVQLYWEKEPDVESIRYGLNSNSHYDNILIDNFVSSITPVFSPMPDNIDENWKGIVFGGEFELDDLFHSAVSFKIAGDRLIEIGLANSEERELFQPAMYSYRHCIELYIKSVIGQENNHDLKYLYNKLVIFIKEKWNVAPPEWLSNLVSSFDSIDPKSTSFRYGINVSTEELYADMNHIKNIMNWLSDAFLNIKNKLAS